MEYVPDIQQIEGGDEYESEQYFREEEERCKQANDLKGQVNAIISLAYYFFQTGDEGKSSEEMARAKQTGAGNLDLQVMVLVAESNLAYSKGGLTDFKVESPSDAIQNVASKFKGNNDAGQDAAAFLLAMAASMPAKKDPSPGMQKLLEARALCAKEGDKKREAGLCIMIGNVSQNTGDFGTASRCYAEARSLAQQAGNKESEADAMNSSALLMLHGGNDESARMLLLEAKTMIQGKELDKAEAQIYTSLSQVYLKLEMFTEAMQAGFTGREAATKLGMQECICMCSNAIAMAIIQGIDRNETAGCNPRDPRLTEAYNAIKEALKNCTGREGSGILMAQCLLTLASVLIMMMDGKGAITAAKTALNIYEIVDMKDGIAHASLKLSEAHVCAGQTEDRKRKKDSLPQSNAHQSAAGVAAAEAKALFKSIGVDKGAEAAQMVLDLDRVSSAASLRNRGFPYRDFIS